jgi:PBP1b-binding outer membrane lipoprotein LpoB
MKRAALALLAIAAVALTGCSAGVIAEPAPTETVYVTATPEPVETVEAAPVEVTTRPTAEAKSPEAGMRDVIENNYGPRLGLEVDDLMGAAACACDQIAAGTPQSEIVPLEGATETQNADFVFDSATYLCP